MEETAEERRQRLKRLREEAQGQGHRNDAEQEPAQANAADKANEFSDLSFRNYKPRNEVIGVRKKEASKPRELDAPSSSTLIEAIKDDQTALDAFAPKKPHMDLKRDVARSLKRLERSTARAIDELRVELELKDAAEEQQQE